MYLLEFSVSYMSEHRNMLNINFWTDPSSDEDNVSDKHGHYKKNARSVDKKQGTGRLAF